MIAPVVLVVDLYRNNGQFAITTAALKQQHQAERRQRAEELKSELGGWAESMGIDADDLRGLFA